MIGKLPRNKKVGPEAGARHCLTGSDKKTGMGWGWGWGKRQACAWRDGCSWPKYGPQRRDRNRDAGNRALPSPRQEVYADHHTCRKWQDSSEARNSTRACGGWLLEPPGWLSLLFLSCRIRKPIITNMCRRSSLPVRVPQGRAKMM